MPSGCSACQCYALTSIKVSVGPACDEQLLQGWLSVGPACDEQLLQDWLRKSFLVWLVRTMLVGQVLLLPAHGGGRWYARSP